MRLFLLRRLALLAGVLTYLLPAIGLPPLYAQDSSSDARLVMSAGMLKRLGAAVDGHRTGTRVWVVIDSAAPYTVWGVFEKHDPAIEVARRHPGTLALGPYYAPTDDGLTETFMATTCWKDQYTQWHCPDSLRTTSMDSVLSVTVTVQTRDGRRYVSNFGPDVEAVFFTLSAIDRLLLPYYTTLYGPEYAKRQRQEVVRRIRGQQHQ